MTDSSRRDRGSAAQIRRAALDEMVAQALAVGETYAKAGERAGWTSKTVQRRMSEPDFAARVEELRSVRVRAVCGRLIELSDAAAEVLAAALQSDNVAARLKAADLVLKHLIPLRRHADLERQVADELRAETSEATDES